MSAAAHIAEALAGGKAKRARQLSRALPGA